jgi:hypothetical protein
MNFYTIKYESIPVCKTCGCEMDSWYAFQTEFEHTDCSAKRIAGVLVDLIKKDLNERTVKNLIPKESKRL